MIYIYNHVFLVECVAAFSKLLEFKKKEKKGDQFDLLEEGENKISIQVQIHLDFN